MSTLYKLELCTNTTLGKLCNPAASAGKYTIRGGGVRATRKPLWIRPEHHYHQYSLGTRPKQEMFRVWNFAIDHSVQEECFAACAEFNSRNQSINELRYY